ncbi:hypothetical protein AVEN_203326-1 [Araneus ventricosus]|uniref:Uncharacterized protein n=1 Tax=Araneus ventricosus TaxID=182803 RepID=A0A4Y2EN01_ARAVE|nr:hypothetical protein AVEN_203326-1 [Araneus ventricosus]
MVTSKLALTCFTLALLSCQIYCKLADLQCKSAASLLQTKIAIWEGLGSGAGGLRVRNPIPLKLRRVWGLLHVKSYVAAKRPPVGVAWKFEEGVPVQMSSSSSDCGSKLRGPSQNSPRVASKRNINITN